jgi:NAD(P)-dependent dehydrogenase (short-subunit alcohol dehydrogenase family)
VTDHDRPVALVTGASRGIGRCTAIALAERGHDVVISARTVREGDARVDTGRGPVALPGSLESTTAAVEAVGGRAHAVAMDLLDRASVQDLGTAALERWGRVDVLVNNAIYQGTGPMERILDLSIEDAETMVRADYLHQLVLVQALLPPMLERGAGCIVNMSSGSAHIDPPAPAGEGGWGVGYAAAKAAFTRVAPVVHVEFGGRGIRAYNVDPGFIVNERMRATAAEGQFTDAGFVGVPPEVPAAAIAWLVTEPTAAELSGTLVFAQRLAKTHRLVPGWPPVR